ncbi:hypothetical protein [Streptomyces zaomyceticus]|uniref:hypothetical protein n=1 Tax=Streptomyces zaomyceticus TaxID=68286 RepID=UPI0036B9320C
METKSHSYSPHEAESAAALFMALLEAAGEGTHHVVVAVAVHGDSVVVPMFFRNDGETTYLEADSALQATELIALAATVGSGGAVVRTHFPDETSNVRGWRLAGLSFEPLSAIEILDAYCTNPAGAPLPPEEGVRYMAAPPLRC